MQDEAKKQVQKLETQVQELKQAVSAAQQQHVDHQASMQALSREVSCRGHVDFVKNVRALHAGDCELRLSLCRLLSLFFCRVLDCEAGLEHLLVYVVLCCNFAESGGHALSRPLD